jgi:hypothetical protein
MFTIQKSGDIPLIRKFAVTLALMAAATAATAATYNGQGTYTIGTGGDYATLGAFAADFTALTSGMTGDTTLSIISDTSEPTNPLLGAPTNGFTLTIKPAATKTPTITFTKATLDVATSTGLAGNLVIGPRAYATTPVPNLMLASNYATMKVVIDGSNTVNGTTRDLTFQNTAATPEINRFIINFHGDCDNSVVKNCRVISNTAGATDNIGIVFWHHYSTDAAPVNLVPDNCTVSNCEINTSITVGPSPTSAGGSIIGIGIKAARVGTGSFGTAINGLSIVNNDITAALRCVYLNDNSNTTVDGNRLKIQQLNGGGNSVIEVVKHDNSNSVFPWTVNVTRNTVNVDSQSTRGIHAAFNMGGGTTTGLSINPGTVTNIINNMASGNCTAATPASTAIYHLVELELNTMSGTVNVDHNSLNLEDWAGLTSAFTDADNFAVISTKATVSNQFAGTLNVRNNIIRVAEDRAKYYQNANTTTAATLINFENNTVYRPNQPTLGTGIHFAELPFGTNLNDFAAWQATGRDTASTQADPITPGSGGKWISTTNLHFDAEPNATFQTATSLGVSVDLDNQARPNGALEKGADEFYVASGVQDWSIY